MREAGVRFDADFFLADFFAGGIGRVKSESRASGFTREN